MNELKRRFSNAAKKAQPITPKLNVIFSITMLPFWGAFLVLMGYPFLIIDVLGRKDFYDAHRDFTWGLAFFLLLLSGFLMIIRNEAPGPHWARMEKGGKSIFFGAFLVLIGLLGVIAMVFHL